jgi:hypothetical protein
MDFVHIAAMAAWALGLPLLFWHRWPRLSFAYTLYAVVFVIASQGSQWVLGECFLTTFSRDLWAAAGVQADGTFTGRLVNFVAGIRPRTESVLVIWEVAIVVTCLAVCWSLFVRYARRRRPQEQEVGASSADQGTR